MGETAKEVTSRRIHAGLDEPQNDYTDAQQYSTKGYHTDNSNQHTGFPLGHFFCQAGYVGLVLRLFGVDAPAKRVRMKSPNIKKQGQAK